MDSGAAPPAPRQARTTQAPLFVQGLDLCYPAISGHISPSCKSFNHRWARLHSECAFWTPVCHHRLLSGHAVSKHTSPVPVLLRCRVVVASSSSDVERVQARARAAAPALSELPTLFGPVRGLGRLCRHGTCCRPLRCPPLSPVCTSHRACCPVFVLI